jgi:Ca2+-binding RTX toxin-like protein
VTGGLGQDQISGNEGNDFIDGGAEDDLLFGNAGADVLIGGDGADQLDAGDDNDTLYGDAGDDTLVGGAGDDVIDGGPGMDAIAGGLGDDEIHAGEGNDTNVQGNDGNDIIYGDAGDDVLFGQSGDDQLFGGTGNDQLVGDAGQDTLLGDDGDDVLFGQDDNDILQGGAGLDTLHGGDGDDMLTGGEERDFLYGENGNDVLSGGTGDDDLWGQAGDDNLDGGQGNDQLVGDIGNDSLSGGSGADTLYGDAGIDILNGGADNDRLQGGGDSDILNGDAGDDILYGDSGDDVFRFEIGDGQDTIIEQGDSLGDFLKLGAGITATDLIIEQDNNDLSVSHLINTTDHITIRDWFLDPANKLNHIEFNDGTQWNQTTIENNINYAPIANPDSVNTNEDTLITIMASTLTANDNDPNSDPLSISSLNNVVNGIAVLDQDGNVIFTPDENFNGTATFDYTVTDGKRAFNSSIVTVDVASINDVPTANPDTDTLILKPTDITLPPNGEPVLTGKDEILVNTTVYNAQNNASIASLSSGGYVIIWSGNTNAGDSFGVVGQLFDEFGNKLSSEFLVNTNTSFSQERPSVTALSDGGFIVVWSSRDSATGDNFGIAAQRFDGAGNKIGTEFLVNTLIVDTQWSPDVTGLNDGGFVVTWVTNDPTSGSISTSGIAGQRYDSSGNATGNEFLVNTGEVFISSRPKVTSLSNGGFIIVWDGNSSDSDGGFSEISYQLFDSNGNAIGNNVIANTNDVGNQSHPNISILLNGNFVITWDSRDPVTGDAVGVAGQLFDINGNMIGNEFLINSITTGSQAGTSVTGLSDGGFVVSWTTQGITSVDIAAQRFDAVGNRIDGEFIVNEFVAENQFNSTVETLPDGGFVFAYTSTDPALGDPAGSGTIGDAVASRIFRFEVPPATDNTISVNVLANDTDVDDNILTFTLDTVTLQGTKGETSIVNNQLFYDAGVDFEFLDEGDVDSVTIDYTMSDDDGAVSSSRATVIFLGVNDLPYAIGNISDQITDEDAPFSFTSSAGIFKDPDIDDSLGFSATLSSGSALPAWLSFDVNTLTFSGTPENEDVGVIDIDVRATDNFGEAATTGFSLTVNNVNDAPVVNALLPNQFIQAETPFNLIVPTNSFIDIDVGDTLSYSATQDNGGPLPAWLNFDTANRQFSGTPGNTDNGLISVRVTVTDTSNASAFNVFDLTVNAIPEPGLDEFNILENIPITITPPELLTNDSDRDNDPLTVTAAVNPIGGGVNMDSNCNIVFTPNNGFIGEGSFDYTVSDGRGGLSTGQVIVNVFNPVTGDASDNILNGSDGYDLIDGGAGNDILTGAAGNDTYLFGRGDGSDIIIETDTALGGDRLRFDDDIAFADVEIVRQRKDLNFTIKDTGDVIMLQQWKAGKGAYPITVEFSDGTVLTSDDLNIKQKLGDAGNDTVRGSRVNDRLYGFEGNDTLIAKAGDDLLDGGAGNDLLQGMSGNDTYQFTSGWGNDTLIENDIENDPSSGNTDTVAFGSGINSIDLMFERLVNDLHVTQVGSTDTIDIQNWYQGSEFQTEVFHASDGSALLNSQVEQLIQAMAAFSADTGLDWNSAVQQRPEEVEAILAASWQSSA